MAATINWIRCRKATLAAGRISVAFMDSIRMVGSLIIGLRLQMGVHSFGL